MAKERQDQQLPTFQARNVTDGFDSMILGMNSSTYPAALDPKQYHKGINVTCRAGTIKTRPPFQKHDLDFEFPEDDPDRFAYGKFQGAFTYQYQNSTYTVCCISGFVYMIDAQSFKCYNLTATVERRSQYVDRVFFCQVKDFMVIQDGINNPMIVEGFDVREADPDNDEVPIGTIMAFGHGRLFLKVGHNRFLAGDIDITTNRTKVLQFTETQYLAGGGDFTLPAHMGEIRAMIFAHNFETGTGSGPLLVFCDQGVSSYRVNEPRLSWQETDISNIEFLGAGGTGQAGVAILNEDSIYVSWEGFQSLSVVKTIVSTKRHISTLSKEIDAILDQETQWMLPYTSLAKFDGRLLFTVVGEKVGAIDSEGDTIDDYRFKGLASLDFTPIESMIYTGGEVKPAWDGVWTGIFPLAITKGVYENKERCFVFGKNDAGRIELWEIKKTIGNDGYGDVPINCRLYTRAMPFYAIDKDMVRSVPYYEKHIDTASIWIKRFWGSIDVKLWVQTDFMTEPALLTTAYLRAGEVTHELPDREYMYVGREHAWPRMQFPAFDRTLCDPISGRSLLNGHEFLFCLEWDGAMEISRMMVQGHIDSPKRGLPCPKTGIQRIEFPRDDFDYKADRSLA